MREPIVEAVGVHKSLGANHILRGVDLVLPRQTTSCIIGPSGSGKSTFLRCINHLEKIDSGELRVEGAHVGYRRVGRRLYELSERETAMARASIGMVFQEFNLFPHLTVEENLVEAPLRVLKQNKVDAADNARRLLDRVGLLEKRNAYPANLSGGQKQRVAIARALAMEPRLMLFDEPTSALDPEMVQEVLDVIRDLVESGMSTLIVTHELGFAQEVADTVVVFDAGRVVESGPPAELFAHPSTERSRALLEAYRPAKRSVGENTPV